ncbi:MAG: thioesterase family protein [Pseudomonadota bacterium]
MPKEKVPTRDDYREFISIETRWNDNDPYGHVNNVIFYEWFDTAVNAYLIKQGALDISTSDTIGFVVESGCQYYSPVAFPDTIWVGLRVARLGNSSVRYELAIFRGDEHLASAAGFFVHVYVDRNTTRPRPLGSALRAALEPLV